MATLTSEQLASQMRWSKKDLDKEIIGTRLATQEMGGFESEYWWHKISPNYWRKEKI